MKPVAIFVTLLVVGLLLFLVVQAGEIEETVVPVERLAPEQRIEDSVQRLNSAFRRQWDAEDVASADLADDLTVYRRLSLALHGTIPSLEEIEAFRSDRGEDRIQRWLLKMLDDERFPTYFADRLARMLTGTEEGQFVIFRRDRLRAWLTEQLRQDRPWPEMVTDLIAGDGLWTSNGHSNFITAAFIDGEGLDENKLAGRSVRAFLGQRIDCAQCHDHPFDDEWQQADFEGLAAFFGQARVTPGGVIDRVREENEQTKEVEPIEYTILDPGADEVRIVPATVPFHPEWVTSDGSRRQQLASWIIHPKNRRFDRATANRIWGLMFGRSWHEPVDDLPHPESFLTSKAEGAADTADAAGNAGLTPMADVLDVMGQEFRQHDGSLRFLIRLIAESDAFRLRSEVPGADDATYTRMSKNWAVFPLVRLRPEQMIGSMVQAGSTKTIDQNSNLFVRFIRMTSENDFLKQYGDAEDDELLQQTGTIPQALLRMNGKFTRELTDVELLAAAGQILRFSGDDESVVQNCFLACLSRLPDPEEQDFFVQQLKQAELRAQNPEQAKPAEGQKAQDESFDNATVDGATQTDNSAVVDAEDHRRREEIVRDLYWILFNSPGFSWNW